ncbi:MAG: hypothetical protein IJX16_04780 [Clostridia bacterium]|nr:hypothetical protein [Clostridia bacterium]
MAIDNVSLNQAMRPGEIAAINALNLAIDQLNALDVSGLNTRLTNIENAITTINSRLNTIEQDITDATADISAIQADITQIKTTLYTPLSQGGN